MPIPSTMSGRPLGRLVVLLLLTALSGACRAAPREVVLFYPPRALAADDEPEPPLGPLAPRVEVLPVEDRRVRPEVVGVTRGLASMVTGRVRASNDGGTWVRDAAVFELTRSGLAVAGEPGDDLAADPSDADEPRLLLELVLLEAVAAANEDYPGRVVLGTTLRLDGRMLYGRRVTGVSSWKDSDGVRLDAAESLAVALRDALRPVSEGAASVALEAAARTARDSERRSADEAAEGDPPSQSPAGRND